MTRAPVFSHDEQKHVFSLDTDGDLRPLSAAVAVRPRPGRCVWTESFPIRVLNKSGLIEQMIGCIVSSESKIVLFRPIAPV